MTKRTRGRPEIQPGGARPILVTLDEPTIEKARKIGAGNLSKGIRESVSQASQRPDAAKARGK